LSQYLEDNRTEYTNCILNITHNNQLQDGSKELNETSTGSSPTAGGTASNGWYDYNGTANYVYPYTNSFHHLVGSSNNFTITFWVYPHIFDARRIYMADWDSGGANESMDIEHLLGLGGVVTVGLVTDGVGAGITSLSALNTNTWNHIAVTCDFDNKETFIYLDGILDQVSTNWTGTTLINGSQLAFGRAGAYNGLYYDGLMDEVIVTDTAWSSNTVYTSYTNSKAYLGH